MAIVTLADMKAHLGIVDDADDAMISDMIDEAQSFIEGWLGYEIDPSDYPADLHFAVKAQAAHMFENRESSIVGVSAAVAPMSVQDILAGRRNYWGVGNGS